MRGRGPGRRATLVTATLLTTVLLGAAAHADPGTPVIPGQGDIDRAKANVRDRQTAADQIQAAMSAADSRLRGLEASAGLAAEAYDTAVAQAATASQAADAARTHAAVALDTQHQAERRLGVIAAAAYRQGPDMAAALTLLHAGSLHDFAVRRQAMANRDAAEARAVGDARQATKDAAAARQQAEQTAAAQQRASAQAAGALATARAAAAAAQSQVAGIQAQQDALVRQLAAAQGVEVGLERQREAGLAEVAARQEAARRAAAAAAAGSASRGPSHAAVGGGGGGGGGSAAWAGPVPSAAGAVRSMLNYIYAQLGKPYVWGGAGPDVFDCSGLAMRGLEAGGWSFPHPAQWQYLEMHSLSYSQLRPGDLVFWAEDDSNPHTIYHEAVYIGNDRIIQAPRPGGVVEQQSLWVNGPPSFYGRP